MKQKWKEELKHLEEDAKEQMKEQGAKHEQELSDAALDFEQELKIFHESQTVLTLKQTELSLAKQQK